MKEETIEPVTAADALYNIAMLDIEKSLYLSMARIAMFMEKGYSTCDLEPLSHALYSALKIHSSGPFGNIGWLGALVNLTNAISFLLSEYDDFEHRDIEVSEED